MSVLINIFLLCGSFLLMEGVAWITHKYLMHGPLWVLHKDHHQPLSTRWFQKNDLFFLIFSLPGIMFFAFGALNENFSWASWVGAGITLYGAAYCFVHEVIIHRRVKVIRKVKNPYLTALCRAHGAHHRSKGKEGGECFGMLLVPWRFYREAWRRSR